MLLKENTTSVMHAFTWCFNYLYGFPNNTMEAYVKFAIRDTMHYATALPYMNTSAIENTTFFSRLMAAIFFVRLLFMSNSSAIDLYFDITSALMKSFLG
jgi:hypothetical protein